MGSECRSVSWPLASSIVFLLVSSALCVQQLNYLGILAKQSTDRFGLTLREVWNGSRVTRALATSGEVLACGETSLPTSVYDVDLQAANQTSQLPPEFAWLPTLKEDCSRTETTHSRVKRAPPKGTERRRTRHGKKKMNKTRKSRRKDHLAKGKTGRWTEGFITPGTKWCGPSNMARRYSDLGPSWDADRCCRTHDQCQRYILGMSRDFGRSNLNPFTLSHCSCDRRAGQKPALRVAGKEDPLRVPGTMWCGRGYSATSYQQLGPFAAADRCCRRHDTACPHYIPGLSHRYGVYNWRPSTLMHCHCDRRFRTCLKMAGTTASNFVGKLFFNLIQTKCFVLKMERICVERNWWGKCLKTELRRQAHVRPNMAF